MGMSRSDWPKAVDARPTTQLGKVPSAPCPNLEAKVLVKRRVPPVSEKV